MKRVLTKRLTALTTVILILLLFSCIPALASTEGVWNGYWKYTTDNTSATIIEYSGMVTEVEIPKFLGGKPVTTVADGVFKGNEYLESVIMYEGFKTLGEEAFYGCPSLTYVKFAPGVKIGKKAFRNCTALSKVELVSGVSIGFEAFNGCTSLESIYIPRGVYVFSNTSPQRFFEGSGLKNVEFEAGVSIAEGMFRGCKFLKKIELTNSSVGRYAFDESGVTEVTFIGSGNINEYAFRNCKNLSKVTLPERGYICKGAFENCMLIKSIHIPAGIRMYDGAVFPSSIEKVTFGEGITEISDYMLYGVGEAEFRIPDTVTRIGKYGLAGTNIKRLPETVKALGDHALAWTDMDYVPSFLEEIGDYAFAGTDVSYVYISDEVPYGKGVFEACKSLTNVSFADGITAVPDEMFSECSALSEVTLPGRLTNIGAYSFWGSGLTEIIIPDTVTLVGEGAFTRCLELKKVEIKGAAEIGASAFNGCTALTDIDLCRDITRIGENAFSNCMALKEVYIDISGPMGNSFCNCTSLEKVEIGDGVTAIYGRCFYKCENLSEVKFGDRISIIASEVFSGCPNLTSIELPNTIKTMYGNPVKDSGISEFHIPASVAEMYFSKNDFDNTKLYVVANSYAAEILDKKGVSINIIESEDIPIESIAFNEENIVLPQGVTYSPDFDVLPVFNTEDVVFKAGDKNILTVTEDGRIVTDPEGLGTTTVKLTAPSLEPVYLTVTVVEAATGIDLAQKYKIMEMGDTDILEATLSSETSEDIIYWYSTNPGIVAVDDNGRITGVGAGTAQIYACAKFGKVRDWCEVTVTAASEIDVVVAQNTAEVMVTSNMPDDTAVYIATYDALGNLCGIDIYYSADNTATGTVSTDGIKTIKAFIWGRGVMPVTNELVYEL